MKKLIFYILLTTIFIIMPLAGCTKKEPEPQITEEVSRTVKQDDIGLSYTAPELWEKYEETNILPPFSTATPESAIFAQIEYDFVSEENLIKINSLSPTESMDTLKQPICVLLVVENEKKNADALKERLNQFAKVEEIAVQDNFTYYALSQYNGDISSLSEEDLLKYEEIKSAVPELIASIATYPFSPDVIIQKLERQEKTLSFITKTLDGKDIDSSLFGNQKLTVVNFWASYCYPDINEMETLQKFSEQIKENEQDVTFVQVIIDVPTDSMEQSPAYETAIKAKQEKNADFVSIVPDEQFANWITKNLKGLPTTIFVNQEGVMVGEQIQGIRTLEEYTSLLNEQLSQMES